MSYGADDLLASMTVDGYTISFVYDDEGRVTEVTQSRSGHTDIVTSFDYTDGQTVLTDPRGNAVTYEWDARHRVTTAVDQLGRERSQTWTTNDDMDTVIGAMGPADVTTSTYDGLGNPTSLTIPTGAGLQLLYAQGPDCADAQSGHPTLVKCAVDSTGNTTSFAYDEAGNLTEQVDATSGGTAAVSFSATYEAADGSVCGGFEGQMCSSTDGNGNTTTYTYDNGDLIAATPPAPLGLTTYTYDSHGRVASVTDGNGHTTSYGYDVAGRIISETYDSGSQLTTVYNADGTIASEFDTATDTEITYTYNVLAQPLTQTITSSTGAIVGTTTMTYDAAGNLTSFDDGTGVLSYAYDDANQLVSVRQPGGTCPTSGDPAAGSGCVLVDYDSNGNEISRTLPGGARVETTRDDSGRSTRIRATDADGLLRADIAYLYTSGEDDTMVVHSRTSHLEEGVPTGATTTYGYDSLGRLISAEETSDGSSNALWGYAYDDAGNRIERAFTDASGSTSSLDYSYNAANQLTAPVDPGGSWQYDGAGSQTSHGITGEVTTYDDRLGVAGQGSEYQYTFGTGNDRRLSAGATNYLNTPLGLSRQTAGTNSQAWIRTAAGAAVGYTSSTGSFYYATDRLGSVVGLFDADGEWLGGYSYWPYGETRSSGTHPELANNRLRYIGGHYEQDHRYKLGARYYDPTIGRFTQLDPTGQEVNPYAYANDDPVNYLDPTGTNAWTCAAAAGSTLLAYTAIFVSIPASGGITAAAAIGISSSVVGTGYGISEVVQECG